MLGLALIYPDVVAKLRWTIAEMHRLEPKLARRISDPSVFDRLVANRQRLAREADLLYRRTTVGSDDDMARVEAGPAPAQAPVDRDGPTCRPGLSDRDLLIVARYRRICQHGMGAVGVVRATAEALGDVAAARRLARMIGCIQASDKALIDFARGAARDLPDCQRAIETD